MRPRAASQGVKASRDRLPHCDAVDIGGERKRADPLGNEQWSAGSNRLAPTVLSGDANVARGAA